MLLLSNSYAVDDQVYRFPNKTVIYPEKSKYYGLDFLVKDVQFKNMNFIECYEYLSTINVYTGLLNENMANSFRGIEFDKAVDLKSPILNTKTNRIFNGETPFITMLYCLASDYGLKVYFHQHSLIIDIYDDEDSKHFYITPALRSYFKDIGNVDNIEKHLQEICSDKLKCTSPASQEVFLIETTNFSIKQLEAYFFLIETSNLHKTLK